MNRNWKAAIVVGGTSGIGEELVHQLARNGTKVAVVGRNADKLSYLEKTYPNRVFTCELDITKFEPAGPIVADLSAKLGGLDLFIFSAGIMPSIGADEFSFDKDKAVFDTNITAASNWFDAAAIRFQAVGHGAIVGIGSVAGERGRAGQPAYNASKAAMHTFLESLRNRLSQYGVTVCTIKPGPVDTPLAKDLSMKKMPTGQAASKILKLAGRNGEFFLDPVHQVAFFVIRNIPSQIFRRLKI